MPANPFASLEADFRPCICGDRSKLFINLKAAKTLGVTVPLPLLGRADQVIE